VGGSGNHNGKKALKRATGKTKKMVNQRGSEGGETERGGDRRRKEQTWHLKKRGESRTKKASTDMAGRKERSGNEKLDLQQRGGRAKGKRVERGIPRGGGGDLKKKKRKNGEVEREKRGGLSKRCH